MPPKACLAAAFGTGHRPASGRRQLESVMRSILIVASLAAAVALAGCSLTRYSAPLQPAPTPGLGEAPVRTLQIRGSQGDAPMSLRVYDRSFALIDARSATEAELVESEPLDENTVAAYQTVGNEILVKWTGSTCAETGNLFIGPGIDEVIIAPADAGACDPTASIRGVVLDFKLGVDLKAISFDIRRA